MMQLLMLATVFIAADAADSKKELENLQGTWLMVGGAEGDTVWQAFGARLSEAMRVLPETLLRRLNQEPGRASEAGRASEVRSRGLRSSRSRSSDTLLQTEVLTIP